MKERVKTLKQVWSFVENERHVAEDQGKIDGLKDELRDKSARVNELEVG